MTPATVASQAGSTQQQGLGTAQAERLKLTPTEELEFACLFVQAQDAASPVPVLGDPYAQQYINQVECDFSRSIFTTDPRTVQTLVRRNKLHDMWLQHYIDSHARTDTPITVLRLNAGLDSRHMRVNRGPSVRWIDIDTSAVIAMRRRLMPPPSGDYTMIAADITEEGWMDYLPADRPTYILAEELLMWMQPAEGKRMLQRLVEHFHMGWLATDMIGSMVKELSALMPMMRSSGVKFKWAINDGREIEALSPRLALRDVVRWYELLGDGPALVDNEAAAYAHSTSSMAYPSATASVMSGGGAREDGSITAKEVSPRFFGRWTALAQYIPGFKNCAQVVLLDFGDAVEQRRRAEQQDREMREEEKKGPRRKKGTREEDQQRQTQTRAPSRSTIDDETYYTATSSLPGDSGSSRVRGGSSSYNKPWSLFSGSGGSTAPSSSAVTRSSRRTGESGSSGGSGSITRGLSWRLGGKQESGERR